MNPNTPILVGVGLTMPRDARFEQRKEPLALMIEASTEASKDSGSPKLLQHVKSISVPVGRWRYRNPGKLIGQAIGSPNALSISALPGISQQTLISDACSSIDEGEIDCALVVGGEAGYRIQQAKAAGVKPQDTVSEDLADVVLKPQAEMLPDYEQNTGLGQMPVGYYALLDCAFRRAQQLGIDEHRDRIAAQYSQFSHIAANNPHAWYRNALPADDIRNASSTNPMLAFPYTKLHNAQWNVDQASALLFVSVALAEKLNIPRERWIFPQVFTEANHMLNITARGDLHRCLGAAIAGAVAFDAAACKPQDLDYLELYSCFPIAVASYARELNIPTNMDWSFSGGMPFAGGPFNNFVLHTVAQLAQRLRQKPGGRGMVTTVSGILTKQGFGIWGTEPGTNGFQFVDVTGEVAAKTKVAEVIGDYAGHGVIAAYTVLHKRTGADRAVAIIDLPDNHRTIAYTDNETDMTAMETTDFCGLKVNVNQGRFTMAAST